MSPPSGGARENTKLQPQAQKSTRDPKRKRPKFGEGGLNSIQRALPLRERGSGTTSTKKSSDSRVIQSTKDKAMCGVQLQPPCRLSLRCQHPASTSLAWSPQASDASSQPHLFLFTNTRLLLQSHGGWKLKLDRPSGWRRACMSAEAVARYGGTASQSAQRRLCHSTHSGSLQCPPV